MLVIRQAAISEPQKKTSPRTRFVGTPTLTVCWPLEVMNVSAYVNSWIVSVKAKITADRMPASEIGMMICTIARARLQPSTIAASSMSLGIDLKNPMRSHTQNGIVNDGYTTTSDQSVSCRPRIATIRDMGMKSNVDGTR